MRRDLAAELVQVPPQVAADGALRGGDMPRPGPSGQRGTADLERASSGSGSNQLSHGASVASGARVEQGGAT